MISPTQSVTGGTLKKPAIVVLLVFAVAVLFAGIARVVADSEVDPPEFYFTRLIYSQNGEYG